MSVTHIFLTSIGILALVALNGFFVAAEFAIVKVRSTQLEPLAKAGARRAQLAQHVIGHLDSYLSACQLGVTMTSLGLGWIGEPFVANMVMPLFALFGIAESAILHTVAFALGFAVITYLHIVLGEQSPKWLAIQYARSTTLAIARPLDLFFRLFRPFIWFLNISANAFLRLVGVKAVSEHEMAQSEEELRLMLSRGKAITSTGKSISLRALELRDRTVRQVMVPRMNVVVLDTNKTIEQNLALAVESQFTRYPLCDQNMDNVVGMVHLKDLIKLKGETGPGTRLLEIKREMPFVPETSSLERILNMFLAKRVLMAVAVDEYGGAAGLVTLENVLEELVGEIRDEFDVERIYVQKISETEFIVDGSMPLLDFSRQFSVVPISTDVVTVSGYVVHILGRVPDRGTSVHIGQWLGIIEAVDGIKIKSLRLRKTASDNSLEERKR
jgi:CBS domain containing-hemolysin-like protein